MSLHQNNGRCPYCLKIINRYPGFHIGLFDWWSRFQIDCPMFHVSCAGRGQMDQEAAFLKGASHAHYGESGHNYNAALDPFVIENGAAVWDLKQARFYFERDLEPRLTQDIQWGDRWTTNRELAHVEWKNWKELRDSGILVLVEEAHAA